MRSQHCRICGRPFLPDPRIGPRQKVCSRARCRRERKRRELRRWRDLHPDRARRYQPKVRAWAKAYPDYWRQYRAGHAGYRERERQRMARKRRGRKLVAKETSMRQILIEKVRAMDMVGSPHRVANETPILRRMNAIEDCLRSTVAIVCVAKRTPMATQAQSTG